MSGSWRASTTAAITGGTILSGQTPLQQHRPRLPMSDEKELHPRRAPYKNQESAAAPKGTALRATQRARRAKTDRCYRPSHRPQLPMSTERELRPRRAPVKYHESDDDAERAPLLRAAPTTQRAPLAATDRRYQPSHRPQLPMSSERELRPRRAPVKYHESDDGERAPLLQADPRTQRAPRAEADRRYRETHRAQRAEASRRYRQEHLESIREKDRRYFKANQERVLARQQRYRESHREQVRENQRRYRERRREAVKESQRRYRENCREELREKRRQRDARRRETHPELVREQDRIRQARKRAKKRMKTLTIPLTDCQRPVTEYVQAFCDSLDTNVSPPESFLQLLNEDSHTLLDLDSGALQVSEPSACNDLSFLHDLLSPDEWEQVMDDVQDFDVDDWLEDMTSSDEGVNLIYDLVS